VGGVNIGRVGGVADLESPEQVTCKASVETLALLLVGGLWLGAGHGADVGVDACGDQVQVGERDVDSATQDGTHVVGVVPNGFRDVFVGHADLIALSTEMEGNSVLVLRGSQERSIVIVGGGLPIWLPGAPRVALGLFAPRWRGRRQGWVWGWVL
jgi:hypothetical protein